MENVCPTCEQNKIKADYAKAFLEKIRRLEEEIQKLTIANLRITEEKRSMGVELDLYRRRNFELRRQREE